MRNRRLIVWALVAGLAQANVATAASTHLRIVAANLTSGRQQSYDPGHGARILKGLRPDVVLIQEFNVGDGSDQAKDQFVHETFGANYQSYREPVDGNGSSPLPNGIISRYPISQSGEWDDTVVPNRDFAWARIDVPGPHDLWAISVHLYNKKASGRAEEGETLKRLIEEKITHDHPEDFVVVGGDFNAFRADEAVIQTLAPEVSESGRPTDFTGRSNTNMPRSKPYDWILVNPALQARLVPVIFMTWGMFGIESLNSFPNGLVFDSSEVPSVTLSTLSPVLSGDSVAEGMQHFAVVKDFKL